MQGQNRIYYKGNSYTRQNYIPKSALKNRGSKHHLVQFPQGSQYFSTSRKKQYSNLHHQSEIKQSNLFYEEPNKYDHGTYYVDDIQGALPNTLICQALKNRIKSNLFKNSRISQQRNINKMDHGRFPDHKQHKEQQTNRSLLKMNYHMQSGRMKTQPIQNFHHRQQSYHENPENYHYYQNEHLQKQSQSLPITAHPTNRIDQLQERLFTKQEKRLRPVLQKISRNQRYSESPQRQQNINRNYQNFSSNNIVQTQKEQGELKCKDRSKLFLREEIRKLNPTYLSTENYLFSEQVFQSYMKNMK